MVLRRLDICIFWAARCRFGRESLTYWEVMQYRTQSSSSVVVLAKVQSSDYGLIVEGTGGHQKVNVEVPTPVPPLTPKALDLPRRSFTPVNHDSPSTCIAPLSNPRYVLLLVLTTPIGRAHIRALGLRILFADNWPFHPFADNSVKTMFEYDESIAARRCAVNG